MKNSSLVAAGVKDVGANKTEKPRRILAQDINDRRTFRFFLRVLGYLNGAFIRKSRGQLRYLDWNNARFRRKTQGEYSLKTIERQFPRFQRWCQEYKFERVNVRGRWVVRVTADLRVMRGVPGTAIEERLQAAVTSWVSKGGRCKVDRQFCRKFSDLTAIPLVAVETIWLKMTKFGGFKCRWRGVGRGRKFIVEDPAIWAGIEAERKNRKFEKTDPQTSLPVSIPFRNERFLTSGPAAQGPEDRPLAPLAPGEAREKAPRVASSTPEPGCLKPPGKTASGVRSPSGRVPFQICARFVSDKKLRGLASWLAFARLKLAHLNRGPVVFIPGYALKFAHEALLLGYRVEAIEEAYEIGVVRSHGEAGAAVNWLPSGAIAHAWRELLGPAPSSPEKLWQAFFSTPRRYVKPAAGMSNPAPKITNKAQPRSGPARPAGPRLSRAEAAEELAKLRVMVEKPDAVAADGPALTIGEIAEYLRVKLDLTVGQFAAMDYTNRTAILRRAAVWKTARNNVDKS